MNQWSEYIDIWQGAFLGLDNSSLFNEVPGVTNGPALREHSFI